MTTFIKDLCYALRILIRHPGFVARIVPTVILGVGVNRAIFRRRHRQDCQGKGQGIDQVCCHPSRQIACEETEVYEECG
jgi:hypothetical protein